MCVGESVTDCPIFIELKITFKICYTSIYNVPTVCLATCVFVDIFIFQGGFEAMYKRK